VSRFRWTRSSVGATRLHADHAASVPIAASGARLPSQVLVAPGAYRVGRGAFVLDEPGTYRFEGGDGRVIEQRVVPGASLDDLLTDLSWLWGYGSGHDSLSTGERRRIALRRRVSATCTPLSSDLVSTLGDSGFHARVVLAFTRQELNDEDNGHTMIEVVEDEQWTLYDPSFRTFFTRGGQRLSLPEWCDAVVRDDYEIEPLAGGAAPLAAFTEDSERLRRRMERLLASEAERRNWYERMAGVPLVRTRDETFVFSADDPLAEVLSSYSPSYRPIAAAEFASLWSEPGLRP
jgi:hypothetical protein